jgi:hypothetical protein
LFSSVRSSVRRNKPTLLGEFAAIKHDIELTVGVYDKMRARAQERDPLRDSDLEAEEFLDPETVDILRNLESLHEKLAARLESAVTGIQLETPQTQDQ